MIEYPCPFYIRAHPLLAQALNDYKLDTPSKVAYIGNGIGRLVRGE